MIRENATDQSINLLEGIGTVDSFLHLSVLDRYTLIKQLSDRIESVEECLPEKVYLGLEDEGGVERLHDTAVTLWTDVFHEEEFTKTLERIGQHPDDLTPALHEDLRTVRIGGLILRDANRICSESHVNPYSFYRFMKILGQFNDTFETQKTQPSAHDVLAAMRESQKEGSSNEFVPCSSESTEKYLKNQIDLIADYLGKGELTLETIHDLRRTNRRFLNLFLLKACVHPDNNHLCLYHYLRRVNTILGNFLDENKTTKNPDDPDGLVKIPDTAAHLLNEFLSRITWQK